MTVKLSIEIISPLTPDDRDLLAGLAVMTVAIANREINQMNIVPGEPETEPEMEQFCGEYEYAATGDPDGNLDPTGRVCISAPLHAGRHKFRPLGMN
jgi:hypothetical protein